MTRILFDTCAWIEYFEGSKEGGIARDYLEDQASEIFTSILTVAELSDAFHRAGVRTELRWQDIRDFLQFNSAIVALDVADMSSAGALKVDRRKRIKGFGLIDAITLQSSIKIGAKLLTNDSHLLQEDRTLPLDKD